MMIINKLHKHPNESLKMYRSQLHYIVASLSRQHCERSAKKQDMDNILNRAALRNTSLNHSRKHIISERKEYPLK